MKAGLRAIWTLRQLNLLNCPLQSRFHLRTIKVYYSSLPPQCLGVHSKKNGGLKTTQAGLKWTNPAIGLF